MTEGMTVRELLDSVQMDVETDKSKVIEEPHWTKEYKLYELKYDLADEDIEGTLWIGVNQSGTKEIGEYHDDVLDAITPG